MTEARITWSRRGAARTITGYDTMQHPGTRNFRRIDRSDNPAMATALDRLPGLIRKYGHGVYAIVQTFSDGDGVTMLTAELHEKR